MRCDYCNKNDATTDLENYFLAFSEDNVERGYNICEFCFNSLNKKGVLKCYNFNFNINIFNG